MFGTRKTSNSEKTPETDKCKKNGQKIKDHGRCQQNRSGTSNGIAVVCFCITFVVTQNHVEGLGQVCDHLGDLRSIGYVFFPEYIQTYTSHTLRLADHGSSVLAALSDT